MIKQFHQVVIGRVRGGLDDEHILAAHVLVDLDENLTIVEALHARIAEAHRPSPCAVDMRRAMAVASGILALPEISFGSGLAGICGFPKVVFA